MLPVPSHPGQQTRPPGAAAAGRRGAGHLPAPNRPGPAVGRSGAAPPAAPEPGVLVGPDWVAERLDDPDMLLVEVDGAATYHWSHLPGAGFLDWHDQIRTLTGPRPGDAEAFVRLMSALGASPDTRIVLYGDAHNQFAASALWLLRYHGHEHLHLLDGGREAWVRAGGALTDRMSVRRPTAYPARQRCSDVRATRDDVLAHLRGELPGGVVVDCRPAEAFVGLLLEQPGTFEQSPPSRGHVPAR